MTVWALYDHEDSLVQLFSDPEYAFERYDWINWEKKTETSYGEKGVSYLSNGWHLELKEICDTHYIKKEY